jgi:hypothetical protein
MPTKQTEKDSEIIVNFIVELMNRIQAYRMPFQLEA